MIPKIIHLCWLSGDDFPPSIKKCLDSWKKYLPDYEVWVWNKERFDVNSTLWTKQAYETKKYAFAADYIRLYALYNYGGIYLDSDVIVYKSFDDLLHLPYFIGEDYVHCFEPAIIGSEKQNPWIGRVLEHYENRPFIKPDGEMDMVSLPTVFLDELSSYYRFRLVDAPPDYQMQDSVISIFPKCYFNSRDYVRSIQTPHSYCSHNYMGSWLKPQPGIKAFLKQMVPPSFANAFYSLMYKTIYHNVSRWQLQYENT